jgi:hypothetical protein
VSAGDLPPEAVRAGATAETQDAATDHGRARRLGGSLLSPAGGTRNTTAKPVGERMRARTTIESDALVCPPLLVPVKGRTGKSARPIGEPMRAKTVRAENAVVIPLRKNGVAKPVATTPTGTRTRIYGYLFAGP